MNKKIAANWKRRKFFGGETEEIEETAQPGGSLFCHPLLVFFPPTWQKLPSSRRAVGKPSRRNLRPPEEVGPDMKREFAPRAEEVEHGPGYAWEPVVSEVVPREDAVGMDFRGILAQIREYRIVTVIPVDKDKGGRAVPK